MIAGAPPRSSSPRSSARLKQLRTEPTKPTRRLGRRETPAAAPVSDSNGGPDATEAYVAPPARRAASGAVARERGAGGGGRGTTAGRGRGPRDGDRRRSGAPLMIGLAALALLAVIGAIALANRDDGGGDPSPRAENTPEATASPERTEEPTASPTEEPTEEPTPDPTEAPTEEPTPEPTQTAEASGEPDLDRARTLQLQGYNARRAGDYQTALARSQAALEACGGSRELSPCGYALYEQGAALNALGQHDAAIAALERRLTEYGDNENGEVERELRAARKNARKGGDG